MNICADHSTTEKCRIVKDFEQNPTNDQMTLIIISPKKSTPLEEAVGNPTKKGA